MLLRGKESKSATITIDTHTRTNTYTDTDASTDFCSIAKGKKQRINPNNFDLNEYTQFKGDALRSISIHYKKIFVFLFPVGATKSRDCCCLRSMKFMLRKQQQKQEQIDTACATTLNKPSPVAEDRHSWDISISCNQKGRGLSAVAK